MQHEDSYIPPFIRRLMPDATEDEIAAAAQHLRGYLSALYRMFLRREARERVADSATTEERARFGQSGTLPPSA